jgi:predicted CXXCH cytochrome family protein
MRILLLACASLAMAQDSSRDFSQTIRPVLQRNCSDCHNPAKAKGPAFLKAATVADMEANRGLWRNVAAQLRNRTMPPTASKLTEDERLQVSSWIDNRLRETACSTGDYAGPAISRRLNRREYHNTIRDLLGIDFDVVAILPADGAGGAGFDTNGETLFIPPVLMERYMEAAQQILDRVIITPPVSKTITTDSVSLPIYIESAYEILAAYEGGDSPAKLQLKVDGADAGALAIQKRRIVAGKPVPGPTIARLSINLGRGTHTLALASDGPLPTLTDSQFSRSRKCPRPRSGHRTTASSGWNLGNSRCNRGNQRGRFSKLYCRRPSAVLSRRRKSTASLRSTIVRPKEAILMKNA